MAATNPARTHIRASVTALAIGSALLADAQMAWFFRKPVDAWNPPSLYALLLGFAALIAGPVAIYFLRGRRGGWPWRTLAVMALLCGLCAPFIFGRQALSWRLDVQNQEIKNVRQITAACRDYAIAHGQQFPPSMDPLIASGSIPPDALHSPVGDPGQTQPDYRYAGSGINETLWRNGNFEPGLIAVYSPEQRLGDTWTVGFADGSVRLLTEEEFAAALDKSDALRKAAGLPPAQYDLPWRVTPATSP